MARLTHVFFIVLSIIIHAPIHSMLDSSIDHNAWISKKLLWAFLPPSDFRKLGDTYTMNVHEIHIKHPETGHTVIQTPRYQFMCDMYVALSPYVRRILMKVFRQKAKELDAARMFYIDSFALHSMIPIDSFIKIKDRWYGHAYETSDPIKGANLRFRCETESGHFLKVQILPLNGTQWEYDPYHYYSGAFELQPGIINNEIGFTTRGKRRHGKYVSGKNYTKPYSQQWRMCWFESKFGFIVQDLKHDIYVLSSDLNTDRMEAYVQSMATLPTYERAIAYDMLMHNTQERRAHNTLDQKTSPPEVTMSKKSTHAVNNHHCLPMHQTCSIS